MFQSRYSLCWDSYKNSICSGFSTLQQNGEFVDMTLAADGHYVKVHQVLLAMASPYLKELITSVPSQHPVIFLNNVSYTNLRLLLEYIYTGEVLVQADIFSSFAETAKALHIKGIENISGCNNVKNLSDTKAEDTTKNIRTKKSMPVIPTELTGQIKLPTSAQKIYIKQEDSPPVSIKSNPILQRPSTCKVDMHDYSDAMEDSGTNDNDEYLQEHYSMDTAVNDDCGLTKDALPTSANLQFTVSIRGSLQMILNRYIYNLNSTTSRTGVKRWRCVDYRNNKCSAFVVTKGDVVLNRGNLHNHSYHDKKILAKIEKKAVFSKLDEIKAYREREEKCYSDNIETSMDDDHFISLDEFSSEIDVKNDSIVKNT